MHTLAPNTVQASGDLEVAEFNASTRTTQVRAAGTLSATAALNVSITTTDLHEWQPVLADVGYQEIPMVLQGHASFHGNATGKLSAIAFAGKLQSEDFDLVIPATSRTTGKRLTLRFPGSGRSTLANYVFGAQRQAASRRNLRSLSISAWLATTAIHRFESHCGPGGHSNTDVDEILVLSGYDFPVSGTGNLSVHVEGTKAEPRGDGRVELSDTVIRGQPVQHMESTLEFDRDQVSLDDLHARLL